MSGAEKGNSQQRTLASVVFDSKRMVTCHERFLAESDAVVSWVTETVGEQVAQARA